MSTAGKERRPAGRIGLGDPDLAGTGWKSFFMEGRMPLGGYAVELVYHGEQKVQMKDILFETCQ